MAAGPTVDRSGAHLRGHLHPRADPGAAGPDPLTWTVDGWEPGLHLPLDGREAPTELVALETTYHRAAVFPDAGPHAAGAASPPTRAWVASSSVARAVSQLSSAGCSLSTATR
ncbi:hypothetical protein GCM10023200_46780 [Actinomycetospora chlora]|uniref:Uncharacterized protein n=1 Tax=Actinomycetospora chlora TaxID=663608 RepID=A0ABP9C4W2_9PSEU